MWDHSGQRIDGRHGGFRLQHHVGEEGQRLRGEGSGEDGNRERTAAAAVADAGAAAGSGRGMRCHGRGRHIQVPEGSVAAQPHGPCEVSEENARRDSGGVRRSVFGEL